MSTSVSRFPARRAFALLLASAQLLLGCPPYAAWLPPSPGHLERREPNLVAVPGGFVDVAGGNLIVRREDLVLDTRLGRESFGAVYDSAGGRWRWSFESSYDGVTFVDESGASFAVAALAAGAAIPGTHWVKLDGTRMKTKGGLVHEYGAGGLLMARHWASDAYPRIRHRAANVAGVLRVTSIEQCSDNSACGPLFSLAYDASGRLVEVTDRAGRRAEFGWDAAGRLTSARDALDVEQGWPGFRYGWSDTNLRSITNSEGERTSYAYSGRSLTSATQEGPGSPAHRFSYQARDASGLYHTRHWNPLGEERRFAYDAEGRLHEQLEVATGELTRWAWSGVRMTARTLPNGATTQWVWQDDDVRTRVDPSGNIVRFGYAPAAVNREDLRLRPVASISDSLGLVEARSYDADGHLVGRTNGAGEVTSFGWAQGALASETSGGITTSYAQVGEHGHPERITALGVTEVCVFDAVGNRLKGSDGRSPLAGGIELREFDADRNLSTLTLQPLGATSGPVTIRLEHRSDGQRTRVLRGGDDHEFGYDAFGRLVEQRERVDGVWQVTRFGHDAAGRPSFTERPNGMREELGWGPGGRVASVRRLQGGVLESELGLTYEHGELTRIDDSESGSERYVYDGAGRRVWTQFADGEGLELEHDLRSRVVAERFLSAQGGSLTTLFYEHDLADRRVRIADASSELWAATHTDGRLTELRYGNGLVRSFAYGADGVLDAASTADAAGDVVELSQLDSERVLDAAGLAFTRHRATTSTYGGVEVTTSEEYELRGGFEGSAAGARIERWSDGAASEAYGFDARSNLLTKGDTRFGYNAEGNRVLSVSRAGQPVGSYAYDAAGYATSRNGVPLAWSAAGRLVAHGADTLAWDGLGRIRETHVGGVAARFAFGGRVQAAAEGEPLAIDLGEVVVGLAGGHRYRHLDFRGNVKWVSDDAGQVVSHYRYAPFGLDAVFGAADDPVRFVARPEIGELMLLGARVYDPALGRFLSPDSIFQVVNQFAYTLGNPIWFSDPDGLSSEANASASGFDALVTTLSVLSATFGLLAVLLKFAPVPHLQGLAAVLGLVAALLGLLTALTLAFGAPRAASAGGPSHSGASSGGGAPSGGGAAGSGGGNGGGGGSVGAGSVGGGAAPGCSPAALTALPDVSGWLCVLIPLQLLLGWRVLRRRRAGETR